MSFAGFRFSNEGEVFVGVEGGQRREATQLVNVLPSEAAEIEVVKGGVRPGVKFCLSVFQQSQEWRWKAGRILAGIP